jgi:Asp-tRNA(Asn)/Glu-tRNA(Gln) amidotransferase A subunit family amidase
VISLARKPLLLSLAFVLWACIDAEAQQVDAFELTIPELQAAMASGATTSAALVQQYLDRIAAFDRDGPRLSAMIMINPRALEEAAALDRERGENGARGPLHGIPIVLKDNYDTHDMPTTASAMAMAGFVPPDDGTQVRKLREAGAVFIGKTNLHEFARGIETISSLGGQTRNPYDPRRNPGGSSGGTAAAVAANFAAVGMGSDTCGSIRIPAANNNLFGLRVTQGLSSRDGIIPLSHTQDVGGPLARSMVDLVTVLDATVGSDPADPQTVDADAHLPDSFTEFLDADALQGARLGLLTDYLQTSAPYAEVTDVIRTAVATMQANGAEVVEIQVEGLEELLRNKSVINFEFTTDVAAYLQASGAPITSIEDLLDSGQYHEALEARYRASVKDAADTEEYQKRLATRDALAELLVETLAAHNLDALVYPTLRVKPVFIGEDQYGSMCRPSAHSGLPAISIPAGFTSDGLPVGMELLARPHADGRLIALGYAWEQAASPRRAPQRTPSLISDALSRAFEIESQQLSGELTLDRPAQTLHYALEVTGADPADIIELRLHRGGNGTNGPVVELLGSDLHGSVPIRNEDLADLVNGNLYLVVHTQDALQGAARGQIKRR